MALLSLWTINALSAPVNLEKALAMASRFIQPVHREKEARPAASFIVSHVERSAVNPVAADYYVLNASDGSAFVIVAGDDRAGDVLAYGQGTIDMSQLPCNCRWWLDQYRSQMEYLIAHPAMRLVPPVSSDNETVVAPLLACQWNQTRPYNLQCPLVNGSRCVTGCVATAMAQVMYYWRFPDALPALPAYTTSTLKIAVPELPPVQLMWQDMLDTYLYNSYTEAQGEAVATLMRYCGQSCKMDYTTGQSGAYSWNMTSALKMFGYNPSMTDLMRYNYGDSVWRELILEELTAGRPILYHGHNNKADIGHAFVIDGYDGIKYHVNWGWGGLADGYFALNSFVSGLNDRHGMLFQCFPVGVEGVQPAHDFETGGIYYKITGRGVRVTYPHGLEKYSGHVSIPASVVHDGVEYPVIEIGPSAFADCPDLTSVTIGTAVQSIDDEAFDRSSSLRRVEFPTSVQRVHHQAFADCSSLDTVDIEGLEAWCRIDFLDDEACPMTSAHHLRLNGEEITHLVVPDGLTTVSANLFRNCGSIVSVQLPPSVRSIGNYAFNNCGSLKTIQMGDSLRVLGYSSMAGCVALESVTLPAELMRIDRYAFKGCRWLTEIVIPDKVTFIGAYAFKDCKRIERLTLGARVDTIGSSVFGGCLALDSITCRAPRPPLLSSRSCFHSSIYANATLLVPAPSLEAYRSADFWQLFVSINGYDTSCGLGDVNGDGEMNIADVNSLITLLLTENTVSTTAADVDGDGEITIADVNALIDMILREQ